MTTTDIALAADPGIVAGATARAEIVTVEIARITAMLEAGALDEQLREARDWTEQVRALVRLKAQAAELSVAAARLHLAILRRLAIVHPESLATLIPKQTERKTAQDLARLDESDFEELVTWVEHPISDRVPATMLSAWRWQAKPEEDKVRQEREAETEFRQRQVTQEQQWCTDLASRLQVAVLALRLPEEDSAYGIGFNKGLDRACDAIARVVDDMRPTDVTGTEGAA